MFKEREENLSFATILQSLYILNILILRLQGKKKLRVGGTNLLPPKEDSEI